MTVPQAVMIVVLVGLRIGNVPNDDLITALRVLDKRWREMQHEGE